MKSLFIKFLVFLPVVLLCDCRFYKKETKKNEPSFEALFSHHVDQLKKIYVDNNKVDQVKRLAVVTFVNENGNWSLLGRHIANQVQVKIFSPGTFELLERERIDSLLSEYEFNQSGLVRSVDTKQLGKLLGADLVLVGSIVLNNGSRTEFTITSRIVDLEKGVIKAISSFKVPAMPDFIEKYNTVLERKRKNIAGVYQLSLYDMKIASQKADGRDWDVLDSVPEVIVDLTISNSNKIKSEVFYNKQSLEEKFYSATIVLKSNDVVHLKVFDKDIKDNDLIGEKIFTREDILSILKSEVPVVFRFGQVEKLGILLEDIGE